MDVIDAKDCCQTRCDDKARFGSHRDQPPLGVTKPHRVQVVNTLIVSIFYVLPMDWVVRLLRIERLTSQHKGRISECPWTRR